MEIEIKINIILHGNYITHTLEHFHLNILRSVQLHNLT